MTDKPDETSANESDKGDGTDLKAEIEKWKELARKHETANKMTPERRQALLDAERQLKELQDSSKSDMDKVSERLAAMEKRAADAERRAVIVEVAGKTGWPAARVERLKGDTAEDMLADAAETFDYKPKSDTDDEADVEPADDKDDEPDKGKGGRPKEKLRPGAANDGGEEVDPSKLADQILSRRSI